MSRTGTLRLVFAILVLGTRDAPAAERLTYADFAARLLSLERLAEPVAPGERTGASTSHDRRSSFDAATGAYRGWSANDDGSGSIRREGEGRVMVDLQGPGVLWRVWSAKPEAGHIRVYLDGSASPAVDKPFRDFFGDLEREYPGLAMTLSRGRNAFVPIPFAKACKVVLLEGWGAYFHCTHTQFPAGTEVETFPGFTPEVTAALARASEAWSRRGASPYAAGAGTSMRVETLDLPAGGTREMAVPGAGAVRVLRVKPLGLPPERLAQEDILRELTLSLFWDGESKPSVWAPLGDFFGTSPGLNPFKTRPTGCIDGRFYCHWYMPFASGMRLVLGNDGGAARRIAVEMETVALEPSAAARLLRFSAAWHADDFTGLDARRFIHKRGDRWPDWPLLVVEGRGRYVGMTQHIWKFGGWWGEGDEKFFVDGEPFPSTLGTGSEDYIGYAWAAEPPFVTFDSASAACSRLRPDSEEDTSVCRFHLCDDIPFLEADRTPLESSRMPLKSPKKLATARGHGRKDIIYLFRFIDWLLVLPSELETESRRQITELQGGTIMPHIGGVERLIREEGRVEGRVEGLREGLLEAIELGLELRFGKEALQVLPRVREVADLDRLRGLKAALTKVATAGEFETLLGES